MQNNNNRNDWSDFNNEQQRNKSIDEQAKGNQKRTRNEQRNQGDQARQNNRADQCTDRKVDF
ncbi:hypothetical protein MASR2M70_12120 [Bacillota bacterium]